MTVGIFCIEGTWSPKLTDSTSVLPLLTYIRGISGIPYIHRYVETVEGLENLILRWPQKQYAHYTLGYLGFHGTPGCLNVGRRQLSLARLGELLEGRGEGKTIYFGSCSVLDAPDGELRDFVRQTGVRAVAGYVAAVDWFESSAVDLLLIDALDQYERLPYAERWLWRSAPDLLRRLGFKMIHQKDA